MTQCIDPSDPRYFTQTSDKSYDRHKYQINLTNGKSVVFDDYDIMRAAWFQTDSMFLKSVDVLDKGFKQMNLSLQEVDHVLKALETMSEHYVARAREQIDPGVTDHNHLVQKLKDYRLRLT